MLYSGLLDRHGSALRVHTMGTFIVRTHRSHALRRTPLAARIAAAVAAIALTCVALVALQPAPPAAAAVSSQCNDVSNTAGQGLECQVTVENTLNLATGTASSRVTTVVCSGAANSVTCGTATVTEFPELTTSASQCNNSANGGGSAMRCSMRVINTITGSVTTSAAPVNQCVGALTTGTVRACTPDPATADASVDGVTQCNGSVNGGGGSMTCSVSPSTTSNSAFRFLANQCNGSANGGGALIVCTTDISTVVLAADTTSVETGGETSAGGTGGRTLPNTGADAGVALGIAALLLMSGVAALAVSRRRSVRAAR